MPGDGGDGGDGGALAFGWNPASAAVVLVGEGGAAFCGRASDLSRDRQRDREPAVDIHRAETDTTI